MSGKASREKDPTRVKRGRRNRQRGNESELELMHKLDGARIRGRVLTARKVSRTGYTGTDLLVGEHCPMCEKLGPRPAPDLVCALCEGTRLDPQTEEQIEVKRRKDGFVQIDRWLDGAFAVCYRRDRGDWIITLRLEDLVEPKGE